MPIVPIVRWKAAPARNGVALALRKVLVARRLPRPDSLKVESRG
jgi:hypothetical protein